MNIVAAIRRAGLAFSPDGVPDWSWLLPPCGPRPRESGISELIRPSIRRSAGSLRFCARMLSAFVLCQQEVDKLSGSGNGQPTIGGRKPSPGPSLLQLPTGSGTRARSSPRIPLAHRRLSSIISRPDPWLPVSRNRHADIDRAWWLFTVVLTKSVIPRGAAKASGVHIRQGQSQSTTGYFEAI